MRSSRPKIQKGTIMKKNLALLFALLLAGGEEPVEEEAEEQTMDL